jgi:hypothetical protein
MGIVRREGAWFVLTYFLEVLQDSGPSVNVVLRGLD